VEIVELCYFRSGGLHLLMWWQFRCGRMTWINYAVATMHRGLGLCMGFAVGYGTK